MEERCLRATHLLSYRAEEPDLSGRESLSNHQELTLTKVLLMDKWFQTCRVTKFVFKKHPPAWVGLCGAQQEP